MPGSDSIRPFNIMAKPVCGACNLDCAYCYYTSKPQVLYPGVADLRMSEEVLASYTRQYTEAMPARCEFGWQGGEPLLIGMDFFRKVVDLQREYRRDDQTIINALQTNGTLLDDEWCGFLADNDFLVGISLDGTSQWHDRFRRDRAGRATFHRAWAGLELLRKHNVEFNVLVTLNSANASHGGDVYRYFVNRGVRYLQFIPILERTSAGEPTDFSCTAAQFGRFMVDVFELWAARDVAKVSERLIDSLLQTLIHGRPSMCCYSDRCANAHVLEFNGDLYACDHFVRKEWKIGNIMETPLAELVRSTRLEEFSAMKADPPRPCGDCEFLALCHGGCPKHHWPIGTDPGRRNHFCEGYKMFFRRALPELKRMAESYHRNQQLQPVQTAPPGRPATAGRNDPCPCGSGRKSKNCCGKRNQQRRIS